LSWKDEEMSKVADSIRRGLQEAVAYARGEAKKSAYLVHVPVLTDEASSEGGSRGDPNRLKAESV
jgi:hypothetical protein